MTYLNDDELLAGLGRALESSAQPTPAQRAGVRSMAEGRRSRAPAGWVPPRVSRRFALAIAAIAVFVVAFGAGVVFQDDLPRPVRVAARAIGLPLESPELVEARELMLRLGELVGSTERGERTVATPMVLDEMESVDARMLVLVGKLDAGEKAKLVPVAHEVHLRAVQVLEESGRPQP